MAEKQITCPKGHRHYAGESLSCPVCRKASQDEFARQQAAEKVRRDAIAGDNEALKRAVRRI